MWQPITLRLMMLVFLVRKLHHPTLVCVISIPTAVLARGEGFLRQGLRADGVVIHREGLMAVGGLIEDHLGAPLLRVQTVSQWVPCEVDIPE